MAVNKTHLLLLLLILGAINSPRATVASSCVDSNLAAIGECIDYSTMEQSFTTDEWSSSKVASWRDGISVFAPMPPRCRNTHYTAGDCIDRIVTAY